MYRVIRRFILHILDRTTHILGVLKSTDAIWPCWIKGLNLPLKGNAQSGWKIHRIFKGSTASMKKFTSHVSVLDPGKIPHKPHDHEEEELLIMLSGEADIVSMDDRSQIAATRRIVPETIVYHSASRIHTIQCIGPEPAIYLIFKWTSVSASKTADKLQSAIFNSTGVSDYSASQSTGQIVHTVIFESPTHYLRKLRCHLSTLQPGAGYPPHSDAYDVAILTLGGTVETLDRQIGPNSVIFYAAGEPHGMKNSDTIPARYIVIEFHGGKLRQKWYSLAHKGVHILQRFFVAPNAWRKPFKTR